MKQKAAVIARYLLGLIFTVFGLNGFFHFIPMPELAPEAGALMGAFGATGYFFPVLKVVEVVCGVALLANKFTALSLVVLGPIVVQIFLFHVFLDTAGLPMTLFIVALWLFLMCENKDKFKALLTP